MKWTDRDVETLKSLTISHMKKQGYIEADFIAGILGRCSKSILSKLRFSGLNYKIKAKYSFAYKAGDEKSFLTAKGVNYMKGKHDGTI